MPELNHINLYHLGEPLLNDGLGEFVYQCRTVAPKIKMSLSTNGMLLNEGIMEKLIAARVDTIIVSAHGAPGTEGLLKYAQRNADYETVIKNIEKLILVKGKVKAKFPVIQLKTALFNWNDTDELMERFRKDATHLNLKPLGCANAGDDVYYWTKNTMGLHSSERFVEGSEELIKLKDSGEFTALW